MLRRAPRFVVITNVLVGLAAAGLALKFAARYLPERQPNRLGLEYGTYVRDGSRQKVDWHPFSEEPFLLARRTNKLIFLEVGDLFSRAGKIFQSEHLEDDELVRTLNSHFVCIKCDSLETPWIVATLSLNTGLFQQAEGCMLFILDTNGLVLDQSPIRAVGTVGTEIGIHDWLKTFAQRRVSDRQGLTQAAATNLGIRRRAAEATGVAGEVSAADARALADTWHSAWQSGRLWQPSLRPSHIQPDLLLGAGSLWARVYAQDAANWLQVMRESQSYDQSGFGFFAKSQRSLWARPGYGKMAGQNSLLAATYARAGAAFGSVLFQETGRGIARWLLSDIRDPTTHLFCAGVTNDEGTLDGSPFYDWSQEQLTGAAKRSFTVAPLGGAEGPLEMARSQDWSAARERQIALARQELAQARSRRPLPKMDTAFYADIAGQVLSGLFQAAKFMDDATILSEAVRSTRATMSAFVQPFGDVLHAPEGAARSTGYAGDYVWLARAALDNFAVTGNQAALKDAQIISNRLLELFEHPGGGVVSFLDSQIGFAAFALPVREISDRDEDSINAVAARNFLDLAAITRSNRFRVKAMNTLTGFAGAMKQASFPPAGFTLALQHLFEPILLVSSSDPSPLVRAIAARLPTYFCAPFAASVGIKRPGIYIDRSGVLSGPYGLEEAVQNLGPASSN